MRFWSWKTCTTRSAIGRKSCKCRSWLGETGRFHGQNAKLECFEPMVISVGLSETSASRKRRLLQRRGDSAGAQPSTGNARNRSPNRQSWSCRPAHWLVEVWWAKFGLQEFYGRSYPDGPGPKWPGLLPVAKPFMRLRRAAIWRHLSTRLKLEAGVSAMPAMYWLTLGFTLRIS